jgi:hypothetical protein
MMRFKPRQMVYLGTLQETNDVTAPLLYLRLAGKFTGVSQVSRQRQKYFSSSLCVQTCSEAHPASCPMGTGGPFPAVKRGRGVTLTTHPHLMPRPRMSRSCSRSPSEPPWRAVGLLHFTFTQ